MNYLQWKKLAVKSGIAFFLSALLFIVWGNIGFLDNLPDWLVGFLAIVFVTLCGIFITSVIKYKKPKEESVTIQAEIVDAKLVDEPQGFDGKITEDDIQNNFSRLSWENAEDLVGKLFEKKGYSVIVSQRSADFGIDVHAENGSEKLGIQVKHWNHQVGFEDVAKTLGVSQQFNKVILVNTKNGFTPQAWQHANNNPYLIELWDSNRFKQELRQHVIGK